MCCRQLPHSTLRPISQVLPPITTSHRHHFPDDVVNNHITSPPITQVLLPITTSHCVLLPGCFRQSPHHIRQHMGNRWQCDGVSDYIMYEMMSMWCSNWWQYLGNRTQCDMVIGGSTWVIVGDVIGLLITSHRKWCRCDVVIGDSTWEIGRNVLRYLPAVDG
jgi:hypothetical protein